MNKLLSSLTLIGMGAYGIILYQTSKLSLYIHPRFFEESYVASIVALIIGFVSFSYFVIKESKVDQFKSIINSKTATIILLLALSFVFGSIFLVLAAIVIVYPTKRGYPSEFLSSIFIIVVVGIGVLLPPKSLSSITASQRSIDLNSINLTQDTISAVKNFNKSTSNYSLGDWIAMQNFNPDPNFYVDKEVKVSGFLYKPTSLNLPENTAVVARFIITCCAVDARPVGLKLTLVESNVKVDDWIEVTGKFGLDTNGEIIIISENISKIEEPASPYIY